MLKRLAFLILFLVGVGVLNHLKLAKADDTWIKCQLAIGTTDPNTSCAPVYWNGTSNLPLNHCVYWDLFYWDVRYNCLSRVHVDADYPGDNWTLSWCDANGHWYIYFSALLVSDYYFFAYDCEDDRDHQTNCKLSFAFTIRLPEE